MSNLKIEVVGEPRHDELDDTTYSALGWVVTQHAIDRWVERVPNAKRDNAVTKLAEWATNGRRLGARRIQAGRYVLKVEGRTIHTVHKITRKYVMASIFNSHNAVGLKTRLQSHHD